MVSRLPVQGAITAIHLLHICMRYLSSHILAFLLLCPVDMRTLLQGDVDRALRAGRTVASPLGGVASLRLRNAQGILQEIGSQFTMPVNSAVEGNIVLRAARSGNHRVRVIENDFLRTVHDTTHSMAAGGIITIPVRFIFPGGQKFYHVIVEHSSISANDTIKDRNLLSL